jgi:hypothetical protein
MRCVLILLLCSQVCSAQLAQTDEFDFWEDQITHNYSVAGVTHQGAYICTGDYALRIGDCGVGTGSVTIDVAVNPLCDTIQLDFLVAWVNPSPTVYADTIYLGLIPNIPSCNYMSILIPGASTISADGFVTLTVADTIGSSCTGDVQLSRVKVYSSPGMTTEISAHDGEEHSVVFPNPSNGLFYLTLPALLSLKNLAVFNSFGQIVFSEARYPSSGQINLLNEPDGIYFVHLNAEQGVITQKIILRR